MKQNRIKLLSFIISRKTNLSFSIVFLFWGYLLGTLSFETMAHPCGATKSQKGCSDSLAFLFKLIFKLALTYNVTLISCVQHSAYTCIYRTKWCLISLVRLPGFSLCTLHSDHTSRFLVFLPTISQTWHDFYPFLPVVHPNAFPSSQKHLTFAIEQVEQRSARFFENSKLAVFSACCFLHVCLHHPL